MFPNYYFFTNREIAHKQKATLHAMQKQETSSKIMIREFTKLARKYYPSHEKDISKLEEDFLNKKM